MSCQIINSISDIEKYSYLELGVGDLRNFNSIRAGRKFSVDINGAANFIGTTDQYFETLDKNTKFDIIFIDANHDFDYVLRDFNNAIKHATKWVILHDMIPPSEGYTSSGLCSDSYKILYHILKFTDFTTFSMDSNFGLTFVQMPATTINPSSEIKDLTYNNFMEYISLYKLFNDDEMTKILNR